MNSKRGYYSLIQFCPEPSRAEAVNLGVLLFCPEAGFIGRARPPAIKGQEDWPARGWSIRPA